MSRLLLNFDQEYSSRLYVGRASVAQLATASVFSYDRLVSKGEKRSELEEELFQLLSQKAGFASFLKRLHGLCSDFENQEDKQFRVLDFFFYTPPRGMVRKGFKPDSEMGKPPIGALVSALAQRFDHLSTSRSCQNRLFRGHTWGWFASVCYFVEEMADRLRNLESDLTELFTKYAEQRKAKREEEKKEKEAQKAEKAESESNESGESGESQESSEPAEESAPVELVENQELEVAPEEMPEESAVVEAESVEPESAELEASEPSAPEASA